MGTAVRPARTSPGSWDAFTDVDVSVDAVLDEFAAMATDGNRPQRPGCEPSLAGAALRRAVLAVWCVCLCGMQWQAVGLLRDIPCNTLFSIELLRARQEGPRRQDPNRGRQVCHPAGDRRRAGEPA
jgi:hypothetical protein